MNNYRTFLVALAGGIAFPVIWIILEMLFAAEPALMGALVRGTVAGIAWFVGTLVLSRFLTPEADAASDE